VYSWAICHWTITLTAEWSCLACCQLLAIVAFFCLSFATWTLVICCKTPLFWQDAQWSWLVRKQFINIDGINGTLYGDGAGNTTEENSSVFSLIRIASCCQQGHAGSKTENPLVLNWGCRLMHVLLYNGCKMVVVVTLALTLWLIMAALHSRCGHYMFALWLLMVTLWNRADHYIFMLFLSSSFFFLFLFPRLISAVRDWMSTILPHMMWP